MQQWQPSQPTKILHNKPFPSWQPSDSKQKPNICTFAPTWQGYPQYSPYCRDFHTNIQQTTINQPWWIQHYAAGTQPHWTPPTTACSHLLVPPAAIDLDALCANIQQFCNQSSAQDTPVNESHHPSTPTLPQSLCTSCTHQSQCTSEQHPLLVCRNIHTPWPLTWQQLCPYVQPTCWHQWWCQSKRPTTPSQSPTLIHCPTNEQLQPQTSQQWTCHFLTKCHKK